MQERVPFEERISRITKISFRKAVLFYLGFWTLIATINTIQETRNYFRMGGEIWWEPILLSFTSIYSIGVLFPLVYWYTNHARGFPQTLIGQIGKHGLVIPLYTLLHLGLMSGLRSGAYALLGADKHCCFSWNQYWYEFSKDAPMYLLFVGTSWAIGLYLTQEQQRLRQARLEKELSQAQMENLHHQLQPHFLFNTLNMISSYIHTNPNQAESIVLELSGLLRRTLDLQQFPLVPLQEELLTVEKYITIMKARFPDRLQVDTQVPSEVTSYLVPNMLLQPLIENAIKHGIAKRRGMGEIYIRAEADSHNLQLIVENRISGQTLSLQPDHKGVGLSNIETRLHTLYDGLATLQIQALDNGMQVRITLPASTNRPE